MSGQQGAETERAEVLQRLAAHAALPPAWLATRTTEQLRLLLRLADEQRAAYARLGFEDAAPPAG